MAAITSKSQVLEDFVIVNKKDIPTTLERETFSTGYKKSLINHLAQTAISATVSTAFCALHPPSSPLAVVQVLGVGTVTGFASEYLSRHLS